MSLANYSDLVSAVQTWLDRTDLATNVPDFITLFEAFANRKLRTLQMEATSTLSTTVGVATLPSDYLAYRTVTYNGAEPDELDYVEPTILRARFPIAEAGTPEIFTIEQANSISVRPYDDTSTISLRYFQKVPKLQTNATNWLMTAHPDFYLFGSLVEAEAFVQDDKAVLWKARRDEILHEIELLDAATKGEGWTRIIGWVC